MEKLLSKTKRDNNADKKIIKKGNKDFNNPKNIEIIKDVINDSYVKPKIPFRYDYINTFNTFKSINNIIYLIYSNANNSIIFFNLINNCKLNEIKKAHKRSISSFRNYIDEINYKELLMSISERDNNIKIWNIKNLELIYNFENINEIGSLYSACFLKHNNNQIYIATSNYTDKCPNNIQIFNLNGKKIKDIYDSDENTFLIDVYYDNSSLKTFIITGNIGFVKSFDYDKNKLYFEYKDKNNSYSNHKNLIINKKDNITRLIESCNSGYIRIWNFHTNILLKRIISRSQMNSICLWNDEYLFVGYSKAKIRLLEIESESFIKDINFNNAYDDDDVIDIKKINHPKYGECLIYQTLNQIQYLLNKDSDNL